MSDTTMTKTTTTKPKMPANIREAIYHRIESYRLLGFKLDEAEHRAIKDVVAINKQRNIPTSE